MGTSRHEGRIAFELIALLSVIVLAYGLLRWQKHQQDQQTPTDQIQLAMSYQPMAVPYGVQVADRIILTHPTSSVLANRQVPIRVYYPQGDGLCPVVLFSPGLGGTNQAAEPFLRYLASQGYLCIAATHDDGWETASAQGENENQPRTPEERKILGKLLNSPELRQKRTADLSLILDRRADIEHLVPQLKGRFDIGYVAAAGHGLGANIAMLMAGLEPSHSTTPPDACATTTPWPDDRIVAVLAISPWGKGVMGLTDPSWSRLDRPTLVTVGSQDRGPYGQWPGWRSQGYDLMPPGDKYQLRLQGGWHWTAISPPSPLIPAASGPTTAAAHPPASATQPVADEATLFGHARIAHLAFLDAYLKNDPTAKAYLQSTRLEVESRRQATLASK